MRSIIKESAIQAAVFEWAAWSEAKYPELRLMHHIPNGGSRNKIEAVNLKRQGVKAGVPDIFLPVVRQDINGKFIPGLYIEMKRPGGKLSDAQKYFRDMLLEQGYIYVVCDEAESAIRLIEWYLNLKRCNNGRQTEKRANTSAV